MKVRRPIITLLTDFGPGLYAAAVKGILLRGGQDPKIVDISHHVRPQDVLEAALTLQATAHTFPRNTVHCVIVDPRVGTERRIVLVKADDQIYLAPDNGCLTFVLRKAELVHAWSVQNDDFFRKPVCPTFHGRDIFAPVASAIAGGEHISNFGPELDPETLVRLPVPEPVLEEGQVRGQVIFIDRFGNLLTNIEAPLLRTVGPRDTLAVHLAGRTLSPLRATYADAPNGEPLALVGSLDSLEIAVSGGSAAEVLKPASGEEVTVTAAS